MSDPTTDVPERRTCITVDLENYSKLDGPTQQAAQRGLADALDAAAATAGLRRPTWRRQASGDGELAVLPPEENEPLAIGTFPTALDAQLRELHEHEGLCLRARMAINHGTVTPAAMGYSGWGAVDVTRLADAPAVRKALREIYEARVVLALSADLFRDIVQQGHTVVPPEQFRKVLIPRIGATAWVMIPQVDPNVIPVDAEDEEPGAEAVAAPVHQQSEATHSTVIQSGQDTTGNAVGTNSRVTTNNVSGSNNSVTDNDFHAPVNTGRLHIGPKHG